MGGYLVLGPFRISHSPRAGIEEANAYRGGGGGGARARVRACVRACVRAWHLMRGLRLQLVIALPSRQPSHPARLDSLSQSRSLRVTLSESLSDCESLPPRRSAAADARDALRRAVIQNHMQNPRRFRVTNRSVIASPSHATISESAFP